MIENIEKFYSLLKEDSEAAAKLKAAQDCYPGSWEIREPFVSETLLAVAAEYNLPFTIEELRKYETRVKLSQASNNDDSSNSVPEETVFYLIDQGWDNDPDIFKQT